MRTWRAWNMTADRPVRLTKSKLSGGLILEGLEDRVYLHIVSAPHTTESLARAVNTSLPTMARALARLRRSVAAVGMELTSVRTSEGYHYEIRGLEDYARHHWRTSRLRSLAGTVKVVRK